MPPAVLAPGDPPPVSVAVPGGRPDLLLVGDHAGNAIPASLGDLGIGAVDRGRHIAWDIGVRALGEGVAAILGATFVHQRFSRLVIDCNRDPGATDAILALSDGTPVPGNAGLDRAARDARRIEIHEAYHQRIADEIALRHRPGSLRPLVVALHSFVPALGAIPRPWHVGVLHDAGDTRASQAMLARLRREADLVVGDNEPYRMNGTDYTIPRHAYQRSLPYIELEIRQDLIAEAEGTRRWAARCAVWLTDVLAQV